MDRASEIGERDQECACGSQTELTEEIMALSRRIPGERGEYIKQIVRYLHDAANGGLKKKGEKSAEPNFRRTATDIINSGFWDGCNEAGVVMAALLRSKNYKLTYIQAIDRESLREYRRNKSNLSGHVFLRVEIDGKKVIVDSVTGAITDDLPTNVLLGKEGFDSWDIGLREGIEDLKSLFEEKMSERG